MEIRVQAGDIAGIAADGIVVNLFEGVREPEGAAGAVDRALGGHLRELAAAGVLTGKFGEAQVIFTLGKIPAARVCVVGLGKPENLTLDRLRHASANGLHALQKSRAKNMAIVIGAEDGEAAGDSGGAGGVDAVAVAQAVAEGLVLGAWRFDKYFGADKGEGEIESVTVVGQTAENMPSVEEAVRRGRIIAEGTNLARDLSNEPGNGLTPTRLSQIAAEVSNRYGLEYSALDREQARVRGMGAFLGVAQGSDEPPFIIVMRYWGAGREAAPGLGIIGKGITFDSGGISLKPADKMGAMKGDMSGGAAVIGAMQAIAQLKPRLNVTGIVPATENLPSGKALKPGDIVRASNGKTVEIISTDAEGRLVLADALVYATQELKLSPVVDAATLTGSITRALGNVRAGLFSNDRALEDTLARLSEETGEKMWPMPMDDEYREQIRSDWADIKNSGGLLGGSITAAWFIRNFVGRTPWAHIDIAGTAQTGDGKERGYINKFGTGVPSRTFVRLAMELANKQP